ncbi:NADH-quinone oxidoreductase subunit C [Streptomyces sp. NPDC049970]|uniref:NADH-quinone oxidoreductase subunit C n=1 Tax=Streptomyces sp. NPDC049970 TaxID=3155033 RepID=UPI00343D28E1
MTAADLYGRLPDAASDIFGPDATAAYAYDLLTVDVPAASWTAALETARDALGCTYFDWLSAVDEPGTGFRVCAHVAALGDGTVRRLLVRTTVPHDAAVLPTAVGVYAGAEWHERETHEMFGVDFADHPHLVPLLLPEAFEGHPLRKDFVLAARVAKAWPGAKEPGESEHGGPKRRTMLPPGVPDPNEWGPLKGQLPPAPARPVRGARAAGAGAGGAGARGDRPVRRARSASEGSAGQRPVAPATPGAGTPDAAGTPGAVTAPDAAEATRTAPPRRSRSASQGSAGQGEPGPGSKPESGPGTGSGPGSGTGSGPDVPDAGAPDTGADTGTARSGAQAVRPGAAGAADAPWHDARPAFDETPERPERRKPGRPSEPSEPGNSTGPGAGSESEPEADTGAEAGPETEPETATDSARGTDSEPTPDPIREEGSEPRRDPGTSAPATGSGPSADSPADRPPRSGRSEAPDRSEDPDRSQGPDRSEGPGRSAGGDTA